MITRMYCGSDIIPNGNLEIMLVSPIATIRTGTEVEHTGTEVECTGIEVERTGTEVERTNARPVNTS